MRLGSGSRRIHADERRPARIGIVGAGISGLATARGIIEHGAEVVVFESRDRVGGRLRSEVLRGSVRRLDLGATWFWPQEHRVRALVADLGVATHDQYLDGNALYHDPDGARPVAGNPLDVPSRRFSDGAVRLAEAIHAALPPGSVRLDTPVHRVDHDPEQVVIHHSGGTDAVDHVVLALPPALAIHRLCFAPELPDRIHDLASRTPVWMGNIVKVVITYPTPFWRRHGLAGSAFSQVGPMRELHDMSGPDGEPAAIFGFVNLLPGAVAPTESAIRAQLRVLFGPMAPEPTGIAMADWSADPDTSPPDGSRLTAYETYGHPDYQRPTAERIHWASTETSTTAPGHIEGALEAAARVVEAVTQPIRSPAPTRNPERP